LRIVAVATICVAIARPERPGADVAEVEGIDIVIALDVSNSMSERDLAPNRLAAAKAVLQKFVKPRQSDRIGLVIFGREAFTQCPLTLDHKSLSQLLDDVRLDLIDGRGTAIGNAIGTALNRLRRSDAKSKVIILLTDGDNNAGNLSPEQAARYAQSLGVKVFTVLMGRDADPQPAGTDLFGRVVRPPPRYPVNPKLLEEIAGLTGGTPYLATDTPALEKRFQAILDELNTSPIKDQRGRPESLHRPFVAAALGLLLLELLLGMTRFRRFP
jgi:Ca-activated chloride channel family protein